MPTITHKDLADHARVSIATVDRVLHDRPGVSPKARQRVKQAIHDLGFGRLPDRLSQTLRGRLRFLFLLPELSTGFVEKMIDDIRRAQNAVRDVEVLIDIRRIPLISGDHIIAELEAMDIEKYHGVGLFAVDAPGVRAAIDQVSMRGIPVVTLVSDVPSSDRLNYVGIDNVAAGRTAGRLMGRFLQDRSGEVAVILGSMHIRDHVERNMGFRQTLNAHYRQLRVLDPFEGDSVSARNRAMTIDLMRDHDNLVGLYSIGGGNTGILSALEDMAPARRPVVIMHELTKSSRQALGSGLIDAVISQDTGHMARSAVRRLSAAALNEVLNDDQERIRIDIFLEENAP